MSMADNIRDRIKRQQEDKSSEQELRELINSAASKSLKQFIQRMDAGEIPIDNISDFVRVLGAYKEINEIDAAIEGRAGQSALPGVNLRQERVLNEHVQEGKIEVDEEEETIDLSSMTSDDVADLIRQMDIAQNKANEEAF